MKKIRDEVRMEKTAKGFRDTLIKALKKETELGGISAVEIDGSRVSAAIIAVSDGSSHKIFRVAIVLDNHDYRVFA